LAGGLEPPKISLKFVFSSSFFSAWALGGYDGTLPKGFVVGALPKTPVDVAPKIPEVLEGARGSGLASTFEAVLFIAGEVETYLLKAGEVETCFPIERALMSGTVNSSSSSGALEKTFFF